jgi:glycogen debranching enzyme
MHYRFGSGLPEMTIHRDQNVLLTDRGGFIRSPSECGFYFRDTRVVSTWSILANGTEWLPSSGSETTSNTSEVLYTNQSIRGEWGTVPPRTLELLVRRHMSTGLHEDFEITNFAHQPVQLELEVLITGDFADAIEVKRQATRRRSGIDCHWSQEKQEFRIIYQKADFRRGIGIRIGKGIGNARYANGLLLFTICLNPGQKWQRCLLYDLIDRESCFRAPESCVRATPKEPSLSHNRLRLFAPQKEFEETLGQGIDDLLSLRFHPPGFGDLELPAAGIPWFVTVFGRDSIISGIQTRFLDPILGKDTLGILGALQAKEADSFRDKQPGKIPHELRFGELAHFHSVPYTPYYGTADATPLYLILLHKIWKCTADRNLIEHLLPIAEGCLNWIDAFGDLDNDGFQEYQTSSPIGYENMGWKDSPDGIVDLNGAVIKGPKALCELQGYVFDAWLRMADIFATFGQPEKAKQLQAKAARLFDAFNSEFWDEASQRYALALDGEKKKILTQTSNIGHCLWSGIIPASRAKPIADGLMGEDMWSGWGIRTLSSHHRAYNPHNYQTGSVWPHDNAIIALGLRRYGFKEEALRVVSGILDSATNFQLNRLPELFAGVGEKDIEFPVRYFDASSPQAWAAGAPLMLLECILGLQFDTPSERLYIDPELPAWLPELRVQQLRVGSGSVNITVWRDGTRTRFEAEPRGPNLLVEERAFQPDCALALTD